MIESLRVRNLKSIQDVSFECKNVNLLVGTNSSGKTSVIQAILLCAQNAREVVGLNGNLLQLGLFEETRCRFSTDKFIEVKLKTDKDGHADIKIYPQEENRLVLDKDYDCSEKDFLVSERMFQYLSCQRVGPENVYKKNLLMEDVIGIDGEYAISFLNAHAYDSLEESMCKEKRDYTLLGQVNWWLRYITDTEISTEEIVGVDLVKAVYRSNEVTNIRPGNVGAGISYVISILIACLSSPENSITVIENPEIHLHPRAQAKICEFFNFIAGNNRQLFIETHSDHIFNGFRAGIATGEMDKDAINIQFISLNKQHVSETMKVEIGFMGKIVNQKKDLFDQFDLDLNRMIGI